MMRNCKIENDVVAVVGIACLLKVIDQDLRFHLLY